MSSVTAEGRSSRGRIMALAAITGTIVFFASGFVIMTTSRGYLHPTSFGLPLACLGTAAMASMFLRICVRHLKGRQTGFLVRWVAGVAGGILLASATARLAFAALFAPASGRTG